jgi:enoyl-CoA hydratase/carnithine racemase
VAPFTGSTEFTNEWKNFGFDLSRGVATVTFNRPDVLNALTFDVYADLRELFAEVPQREDVKAVLLTGEGRGFCSGGDVNEIIGELLKLGTRELLDFTRMTGTVVRRMRECPLPIIAAVNGVAAGAGAVLALASDFRILAHSASFQFLFTKVGLSGADMGSAYLLPRLVGMGRATELLMLGGKVGSARALEIGLATQVVDDDALQETSRVLGRRLASGPGLAYASTKTLLSRELDMDLAGALELEAYTQALLMTSQDHREFYEAFTSKREPRWRGR